MFKLAIGKIFFFKTHSFLDFQISPGSLDSNTFESTSLLSKNAFNLYDLKYF